MTSKTGKFILISICIVFILGGAYFFNFLKSSDELQSKREWSALQELEESYRGKGLKNTRYIVKQYEAYYAVGVTANDLNSRVWILLNPEFEPYIKEIPQHEYYFSSDELSEIFNETKVSERIRRHLESKIKET